MSACTRTLHYTNVRFIRQQIYIEHLHTLAYTFDANVIIAVYFIQAMARLSSEEALAMVFDPDFDSGSESEIEDPAFSSQMPLEVLKQVLQVLLEALPVHHPLQREQYPALVVEVGGAEVGPDVWLNGRETGSESVSASISSQAVSVTITITNFSVFLYFT